MQGVSGRIQQQSSLSASSLSVHCLQRKQKEIAKSPRVGLGIITPSVQWQGDLKPSEMMTAGAWGDRRRLTRPEGESEGLGSVEEKMPEKLRKRLFGARKSPPLLSDEPTDTSLSTPTATGTGQRVSPMCWGVGPRCTKCSPLHHSDQTPNQQLKEGRVYLVSRSPLWRYRHGGRKWDDRSHCVPSMGSDSFLLSIRISAHGMMSPTFKVSPLPPQLTYLGKPSLKPSAVSPRWFWVQSG